MAINKELALAGLMLATGGVFLSDTLSTLSKESPNKISIFLHVHVYVYFLTPLTFYLNILSLFQHVTAHTDTLEPRIPVFLKQYLSQAAGVVSLANLISCAPLLVHISVAEQSVGFAIVAALVLLSLFFMFAFIFKKILISNCHVGRGLMPTMFALCICTGALIYFDPILFFSNMNPHESLIPTIPNHLLMSFLSFIAFILSILLLLVCVHAQSDGTHVIIQANILVISLLCMAVATILVYWYVRVYMTVTGMDLFQWKLQKC